MVLPHELDFAQGKAPFMAVLTLYWRLTSRKVTTVVISGQSE